jgi:hypothetical protein
MGFVSIFHGNHKEKNNINPITVISSALGMPFLFSKFLTLASNCRETKISEDNIKKTDVHKIIVPVNGSIVTRPSALVYVPKFTFFVWALTPSYPFS